MTKAILAFFLVVISAAISAFLVSTHGSASAEERLGVSTDLLVAGDTVNRNELEELGLVRVRNGCSGALLNDAWVLTATHCITVDGTYEGALRPASEIMVTAAWETRSVSGVDRIVSFWQTDRKEVALLKLSRGLSRRHASNLPVIASSSASSLMNTSIDVYGAGIRMFAYSFGGVDYPAASDNVYRKAVFSVTEVGSSGYGYHSQNRRAVAGGDSGGPSYIFVNDPNDFNRPNPRLLRQIVGIHSLCLLEFLPGKPRTGWTWASNTTICYDTSVADISLKINQTIADQSQGSAELTGSILGGPHPVILSGNPNYLYSLLPYGGINWSVVEGSKNTMPSGVSRGMFFSLRTGPRVMIPAGDQNFYIINDDGALVWMTHDGYFSNSASWSSKSTGTNWGRFSHLFGGGEGVVYGVLPDGRLMWNRDEGFADGSSRWVGEREVGNGGWQQFKFVTSGGKGLIYAVRQNGELVVYRHRGWQTGETDWDGPTIIGRGGWADFISITAANNGIIYTQSTGGDIRWYRYNDWQAYGLRYRRGGPPQVLMDGGNVIGNISEGHLVVSLEAPASSKLN